MRTVRSVPGLRRALARAGHPRVLVPTMGALHAGHLALVRRARVLAGTTGSVVVSLFVNPTQFGPREDLARYPRPFRDDLALCRAEGVDVVFAPTTLYAADHSTWVEETQVSAGLCGRSRPGHFRGVCTVVAKLFHLVGPDIAVFGEKDRQQLTVIRRMVRDLDFPVRIVGVPTVREPDGLALSSRNRFLSAGERAPAPLFRAALEAAAEVVREGGRSAAQARAAGLRVLKREPRFRVDYFEVVDGGTLESVACPGRNVVIAGAVFLGKTRLIDNVRVS